MNLPHSSTSLIDPEEVPASRSAREDFVAFAFSLAASLGFLEAGDIYRLLLVNKSTFLRCHIGREIVIPHLPRGLAVSDWNSYVFQEKVVSSPPPFIRIPTNISTRHRPLQLDEDLHQSTSTTACTTTATTRSRRRPS